LQALKKTNGGVSRRHSSFLMLAYGKSFEIEAKVVESVVKVASVNSATRMA
jgi:hypothetical protein